MLSLTLKARSLIRKQLDLDTELYLALIKQSFKDLLFLLQVLFIEIPPSQTEKIRFYLDQWKEVGEYFQVDVDSCPVVLDKHRPLGADQVFALKEPELLRFLKDGHMEVFDLFVLLDIVFFRVESVS